MFLRRQEPRSDGGTGLLPAQEHGTLPENKPSGPTGGLSRQPLRPASNRNQARSSASSVQSSIMPSVALSPASVAAAFAARRDRSEEHTSELQSLMRISYAVFCLNNNK